MDNQYNENYNDEFNRDKTQKKSWIAQCFRWIVCGVAILIVLIVIYRVISTGTPNELKNYIIKTKRIDTAYSSLKEDFKIYKIDIRDAFSMGDALFAENIYYLENAESFQVTVRLKNSRLKELFKDYGDDKFMFYLKVSTVNPDIDVSELQDGYILDYVFLNAANESIFGSVDDKYKYITLVFEDVKINYANTKVELYVFESNKVGEIDEKQHDVRFTLFDINMPKTKADAKKFGLGK